MQRKNATRHVTANAKSATQSSASAPIGSMIHLAPSVAAMASAGPASAKQPVSFLALCLILVVLVGVPRISLRLAISRQKDFPNKRESKGLNWGNATLLHRLIGTLLVTLLFVKPGNSGHVSNTAH